MHLIDWIVLGSTLLLIVLYGVWKTRGKQNMESYLRGTNDLKWWTIGLSIMATQASAITFLSTPGQAYQDGMGFAQFYFGLPVAMVILAVFVLPIYYRLKVFTAYEYLEGRFGVETRTLTAILFLIQRGLAAGLTIFAPAIILSTILGWNLKLTILFIGAVVILYTTLGGTRAVSQTQKQQMIVILTGMFIAFLVIINQLPEGVSFNDAVGVAGKMGKLEVVDFSFDLNNRYTFWTGMLGGVFLFMSYFGTDQSQVQRYLSGKSLTESRLGLMMNGIVKVPMQFLILFVGIMVFMFYQFNQPPIHYNNTNVAALENSIYADEYATLNEEYNEIFQEKNTAIYSLIEAQKNKSTNDIATAQQQVNTLMNQEIAVRDDVRDLIDNLASETNQKLEKKDTDYVFITFVTNHLPIGLVGLLIAVIFSAAMSSTASELNALATTTVIDLYRRSIATEKSSDHYLKASRWLTILWGCIAVSFALFAQLFDNLIEAVNIVGSLFYGAILGVFMVAFFMKFVKGKAVFIAALIGELIVIALYIMERNDIIDLPYLWLNLIGCVLVMLIAAILQSLIGDNNKGKELILDEEG